MSDPYMRFRSAHAAEAYRTENGLLAYEVVEIYHSDEVPRFVCFALCKVNSEGDRPTEKSE